jgi:hypothetical protein
MTIRFRGLPLSVGAWGAGLGRKLTATEFDDNIYTLDTRLAAVEAALPTAGRSISSIEQVGATSILIHMSDASVQGPFDLPVADLNFEGEWLPTHAYLKNDIVSENGNLYIVLHDHTSPSVFDGGYTISSGIEAYALVLASPVIVRTLDCHIEMLDLLNSYTQYMVAPCDGRVTGLDAVIQSYLYIGGVLQVQINGISVSGATVGFPDDSAPGVAHSGEATLHFNFNKGDVISITLSGFGVSGLSGAVEPSFSGFDGAINAHVRYR